MSPLPGDPEAQLGVRWDIFNLLQLGNAENPNVSISATGLHGQGYFGHIFWDTEVYLVPFYLAADPAVARNLVKLSLSPAGGGEAERHRLGLKGARFPWTSTWQGLKHRAGLGLSRAPAHLTVRSHGRFNAAWSGR